MIEHQTEDNFVMNSNLSDHTYAEVVVHSMDGSEASQEDHTYSIRGEDLVQSDTEIETRTEK